MCIYVVSLFQKADLLKQKKCPLLLAFIQTRMTDFRLEENKLFVCQTSNLSRIKLKKANLNVYVALSDPDSMKFQKLLGPFHMDWRTTMRANGFLTIFQEC